MRLAGPWPPKPTAQEISTQIERDFGLRPRVGIEKEFYLEGKSDIGDFAKDATRRGARASPLFETLTDEAGSHQFEYTLRQTDNALAIIDAVEAVDGAIHEAARRNGTRPDWRALPAPHAPPSGLHLHVSLHDATGTNSFRKPDGQVDGPESPILLACIAGLLETMDAFMIAFAPTDACYKRLRPVPYPKVAFSPASVSWGGDNRSVALRLPPCGGAPERRRVEHRLASPEAETGAVLTALFAGLWIGLRRNAPPRRPKTFGLANNPAIGWQPLPQSHAEAMCLFERSGAQLLADLARKIARSSQASITEEGPSVFVNRRGPRSALDGKVAVARSPLRRSRLERIG